MRRDGIGAAVAARPGVADHRRPGRESRGDRSPERPGPRHKGVVTRRPARRWGSVPQDGQLRYSVTARRPDLVLPSALGLRLTDGSTLGTDVTVTADSHPDRRHHLAAGVGRGRPRSGPLPGAHGRPAAGRRARVRPDRPRLRRRRGVPVLGAGAGRPAGAGDRRRGHRVRAGGRPGRLVDAAQPRLRRRRAAVADDALQRDGRHHDTGDVPLGRRHPPVRSTRPTWSTTRR